MIIYYDNGDILDQVLNAAFKKQVWTLEKPEFGIPAVITIPSYL